MPTMVIQLKLLMALLVGSVSLAPAAFAGEKTDSLPGVDLDYRLVKPAPEPPEAPVTDADGFVTIGNTKVKISGLVRFDIDYVGKGGKR